MKTSNAFGGLDRRIAGGVCRSAILIGGLTVAAACSSDSPATRATSPDRTPASSVIAPVHRKAKFLPLGVPMPDTGVYTAIPKPYEKGDPEPAVNAELQALNVANTPNGPQVPVPPPSAPPEAISGAGLPASGALPSVSNDSWRGWSVLKGRGIYAIYEIAEDPIIAGPIIPSGWAYYAPTSLPAGKSCLEVSNWHHGSSPGAAVGVYDFCSSSPDFKTLIPLNTSAFRNNYARSYLNEWGATHQVYVIQVYAEHWAQADGTADTWHASLYNYSTGYWDQIGLSTGTNSDSHHDGWIYHETRLLAGTYNNTCFQIKSIGVDDVLLQESDGGWWLPGDWPGAIQDLWLEPHSPCWADAGVGGTWTMQSNPWSGWYASTPDPHW